MALPTLIPTGPARRRKVYTSYPIKGGRVYLHKTFANIDFGIYGEKLAKEFKKTHGGNILKGYRDKGRWVLKLDFRS